MQIYYLEIKWRHKFVLFLQFSDLNIEKQIKIKLK